LDRRKDTGSEQYELEEPHFFSRPQLQNLCRKYGRGDKNGKNHEGPLEGVKQGQSQRGAVIDAVYVIGFVHSVRFSVSARRNGAKGTETIKKTFFTTKTTKSTKMTPVSSEKDSEQ
jgi:hypothetical protein